MNAPTPYGAWPSPITPELVVAGARGLGEVRLDGDDITWLEQRPDEEGRYVVVARHPDGTIEDLTPAGTNVRTRVHEYGGGSYLTAGGTVWFAEFTDQRLYRIEPGEEPRPVTPEPPSPGAWRYADLELSPDGRHIVCVRERHEGDSADAVVDEIVALPADGEGGGQAIVIASGRDFYLSPRLSPDGRRLAYVAWDHPAMPWDDTELVVVDLDEEMDPSNSTSVTGGPGSGESVILPAWSLQGALHAVTDRGGWWNLHRWDEESGELTNLAEVNVELGQPQWQLGQSLYGFLDDGRIAVVAVDHAVERPAILDPRAGTVEPLPVEHTSCRTLRARGTAVVFAAASPSEPVQIVRVDLGGDDVRPQVLHRSREVPVGRSWMAQPETISFPTSDGATAHAVYLPPTNPQHRGPETRPAPLLVMSHGGPTAHAAPSFDLASAFWTSRGFGVVDVNYRGSTGFGREYRRALNGVWGIADVDDCIAAAAYLAERGDADPARTAIRGWSASGYTTLCALAFRDAFAAGASYFGVADLGLLAEETHKFESRYLDRLVAPYPEAERTYRERSPLHHTDGFNCPVIIFQGLEDRVVTPAQAEQMVDALQRRGVAHAYVTFPDEQHGFRKAANQRRSLEAELSFYGQVFGFEPADDIRPVEVRHG